VKSGSLEGMKRAPVKGLQHRLDPLPNAGDGPRLSTESEIAARENERPTRIAGTVGLRVVIGDRGPKRA